MLFSNIPKYRKPLEFLDRTSIQSIHDSSSKILEEIGAIFDDEKTLRLFEESSCEIDYKGKIVKFNQSLIEECIKSIPQSFSLWSRTSKEMKIGAGNLYFVSAVDNSYIIEEKVGKRRTGKLADVRDIARLMNELEYHHICCPAVIAHDVPPEMRLLESAAEVLRNTEKHCIICPTSGVEAELFIEMGAAIAGSEDQLSRMPVVSTTIAPTSPLSFPKSTCDVIWAFAKRRIPFVVVHAPIAGATSPVTMAGTMALANAESLAEIVLAQLIAKGTPLVYGGAISNMDMRHGMPAYGGPEYGLFSIATAQMGRFYRIPTYGAGGGTNANLSDAQSGYEKMSSSLLAYLAGHDMMCDAALNSNGLTSLDSLVIQDEIMGMLSRIGKGFSVDEDTLSLNVIKNVGPGGDYLSLKHTRDNFLADFYYSKLSSRASFEAWLSGNGKELRTVAFERAKELIDHHKPVPLSEKADREINKIMNEARKEFRIA
jgi:trimethylamine--corrinoid protein Co-methyltransferase